MFPQSRGHIHRQFGGGERKPLGGCRCGDGGDGYLRDIKEKAEQARSMITGFKNWVNVIECFVTIPVSHLQARGRCGCHRRRGHVRLLGFEGVCVEAQRQSRHVARLDGVPRAARRQI